ncbi:hypothetical protein Dimus_038263 [Dionaea muscipula]
MALDGGGQRAEKKNLVRLFNPSRIEARQIYNQALIPLVEDFQRCCDDAQQHAFSKSYALPPSVTSSLSNHAQEQQRPPHQQDHRPTTESEPRLHLNLNRNTHGPENHCKSQIFLKHISSCDQ